MSLITSASPWSTNDSVPKKRIPTMKFPSKLMLADEATRPEPSSEHVPLSLSDTSSIQTERATRVNELINQITSVGTTTSKSNLGDFKPLNPPQMNSRRSGGLLDNQTDIYEPSDLIPNNPLQHRLPKINRQPGNYVSNDNDLGKLSGYQQSYDNKPVFKSGQSSYAKSSIHQTGNGDDKLMERINYMIHLLEQQQSEKTANITEEFLLYTFLGVFVIYVVDSFSRNGKYVR